MLHKWGIFNLILFLKTVELSFFLTFVFLECKKTVLMRCGEKVDGNKYTMSGCFNAIAIYSLWITYKWFILLAFK